MEPKLNAETQKLIDEFKVFEELSKKSLLGDSEAKQQLENSNEQMLELAERLRKAADEFFLNEDDASVEDLDLGFTLVDLTRRLQDATEAPCFSVIKEVDAVIDVELPATEKITIVNGKPYVFSWVPCDPSDYGQNCKEALGKLENGKTVRLFNDIVVRKTKDGDYLKLIPKQLNKVKDLSKVVDYLDVSNGKSLRQSLLLGGIWANYLNETFPIAKDE